MHFTFTQAHKHMHAHACTRIHAYIHIYAHIRTRTRTHLNGVEKLREASGLVVLHLTVLHGTATEPFIQLDNLVGGGAGLVLWQHDKGQTYHEVEPPTITTLNRQYGIANMVTQLVAAAYNSTFSQPELDQENKCKRKNTMI